MDSRAIAEEIAARARHARRVVFVSGNFNVVHPGHLRLLRFASDCGDFLVVGIHPDSWPDAIVPQALRLESIQSISFVNHALVLPESPEAFIGTLRPAVVVKGKEHESRENPERRIVESYGGKLLFGSGEVMFSSLDLLKSEFSRANLSSIVKPLDFMERHGFGLDDLKGVLGKYRRLRVLVLGDLIVDEYLDCDPLGMSQEDPTIVVTPIQQERFIGGAGIVAAHARGLGASVRLISVAGQDPVSHFARERLDTYGVGVEIFDDESRPTSLKQRFRASGKTLLRVSHLRQHAISRELVKRFFDAVLAALPDTDLVMFSDFNYGCLPQPLVDAVVAECGRRGIMMVADSQSSSQVGDISRFKGMALLAPTEREARLALRDFDSGLVILAEALCTRAGAANVILTLGTEGLLAHAPDSDASDWHTDRLPAMNTAPKDPAGAGDSLMCCASMTLAVGGNIWQSAYLGALAAACQVGRIGNLPLTAADLEMEINARP